MPCQPSIPTISYYRQWSHEIPPLPYPGWLLYVDVHDSIGPPLSGLRPDRERFWADSEPSANAAIRLLAPIDSVLSRTLNSVLTPADPERWPAVRRGRLWPLYVRSHWTRMPAHLLLPPLVRKSVRRAHAIAVDG